MTDKKYDVIIIGGGVSGCEAASKLYSNGIENLLLLEAQERIGGRIQTTFLDNDKTMPIEIGANWIHGIVGNPLYQLCRDNPGFFCQEKLELFDEDAVYCADETGKRYSSKLCYEMYDLYRKFMNDAKVFFYSNQKCSFKNYADFIRKQYEPYMKNDDSETRRVKESIIRRLLKQETIETSSNSMDEISIDYYGSYLKLPGPDFEFPGGFSSLIEFLVKDLPEDVIKLNHPVENISLNGNYDPSTTKSSANDIKVKCFNGKIFYANHVIVTCPLNYLKKHYSTLFQPGLLSKTKFDALQSMKMGVVNKIFLIYDDLNSFFPQDFSTVHPLFFNDEKFDEKSEWHLNIFNFDKFYDNILLVWTSGITARYVEDLSEQEIGKILVNLMKKFLKNENIPMPKKVIRTKWNSNPYACGSYSYVDVNCDAKNVFKDLCEPVYVNGVPRILFAGEYTHPRFYSTVHGGYLSAQREVKRLLDYVGSKMKLSQ